MTKNTPIKWHTANIKLSQLKEYPDNPRKITKEMMDKLVAHIKEDGYHQRIIVDSDYTIIGGHQRKKALYMAGYDDDTEIEDNENLHPLEFEWIGENIKTIDDLIRLGKSYDARKRKRYNLNIKQLNKLVAPLEELQNMIGMTDVKKIIFDQLIYYLQNKNLSYYHTYQPK